MRHLPTSPAWPAQRSPAPARSMDSPLLVVCQRTPQAPRASRAGPTNASCARCTTDPRGTATRRACYGRRPRACPPLGRGRDRLDSRYLGLRSGPCPRARSPRQALDDRRPRAGGSTVHGTRARRPRGRGRRHRPAGRRMRLQLTVVAAGAALAIAAPGRGDGTLAVRGVYYKERATRVMQPMLDAIFDAGTHGIVTGHFLVDAITSASASSGAVNATPFNEVRYEGGAGYTRELGALTLGADARFSTESDYRSIYGGLRAQLELGQKNTVLGL